MTEDQSIARYLRRVVADLEAFEAETERVRREHEATYQRVPPGPHTLDEQRTEVARRAREAGY
ncbi:hypothetical protein [Micromonospora sp. WMMD1082]|uniref:hypothetical protein n=1 Tax=Micromonospora sp. WMMD1082 TaxID=3016104 RepID=UPI00241628FB|nr:hypothetical protein [Micromonospora sp. WMMD1082]MDG4792740.1 hypothetical protein [Micromonospora sp. WMMD1082]